MEKTKPISFKMRTIIKFLEDNGYKGQLYHNHICNYYSVETPKLKICVFDEGKAMKKLNNTIAAETPETFNRWNDAYYIKDIPETEEEFKQLLEDLKTIQEPKHVELADRGETYYIRY